MVFIRFILIPLLLLWTVPAAGESIYRKGCENPVNGVQMCWEAIAEDESMISPFDELHLLPIMQAGPNPQPLVELTRTVYRQLMPGDFSRQLLLEWEPWAAHLDEAMEISRRTGWLLLWISPRSMRNSSAATSGLVEWDVYLISPSKYKPERTLRLRLEAKPKPGEDNRLERGTSAYLIMNAIGAISELTMAQTAIVVGGAAMSQGDNNPPKQNQNSMELLTELAVRQILFLSQHNITEINPPRPPQTVADAMVTPTGSSIAGFGSKSD